MLFQSLSSPLTHHDPTVEAHLHTVTILNYRLLLLATCEQCCLLARQPAYSPTFLNISPRLRLYYNSTRYGPRTHLLKPATGLPWAVLLHTDQYLNVKRGGPCAVDRRGLQINAI